MFNENKIGFVKELSSVLSKFIFSVEKIEYKIFVHKESCMKQEYIVITYSGGEIACKNSNCNSKTAIYSEIGKLLNGGYYEEVEHYQKFLNDKDWEEIEEY